MAYLGVRGKPHIHMVLGGRWRCSHYAVSGAVAGYGNTPMLAYIDWQGRWEDWQRHNQVSDNLKQWVRGR